MLSGAWFTVPLSQPTAACIHQDEPNESNVEEDYSGSEALGGLVRPTTSD